MADLTPDDRHPEMLTGPASGLEREALDEAYEDLTRGWRSLVDEALDLTAGNRRLLDGITRQVRAVLPMLVAPAGFAHVAPIDIVHIVHAAAEEIVAAAREGEIAAIARIQVPDRDDGDDPYAMDGAR